MGKRIEQYIIDRILDTARIEEVVGDFVDLKRKGVRYVGLCPFHDDRHIGSFVVYPKRNCYKCFSCDAKGGVVDFLMKHERLSYPDAIRWLGKKYCIETDMEDFNYTPPPPRPKPEPLPTLALPMSLVTAREDTTADNLANWIRTGIKWDTTQRQRIERMMSDYHIGHAKGGHTIFWQIDEQGSVRTGKMMKYRTDGHRDKAANWSFDFIHSTLSRRRDAYGNIIDSGPYPHPELYDPDRQEMRQTLFGMHLLHRYGGNSTVCIVESEKTALLMSIAYGNHVLQTWMACGGLENLTRERLAPIIRARRKIVIYPDRDGIAKWTDKANAIGYDLLTVDTTPVTRWWLPSDGDKADIADVVIRYINTSTAISTMQDVADAMPSAKPLIDKLNLEIEDEEKQD